MNLSSKIEAILFFKGEPVSKNFLAKTLESSPSEIEDALLNLKETLTGRGVVLMTNEENVTLGTAPEFSNFIESIESSEIERDLTKAALETLSIILYRGPVSRAEIDFVRGVNSAFIIRSLLVRGLIDKNVSSADKRSYVYSPSFELLSFLGVTSKEGLPEYSAVIQKIESFLREDNSEDSGNEV